MLRRERIEDALKVLITWSKAAPEQAGRELDAIARDWGVDIDTAVARLQPAGAIYWMMDEADVRRVLAFEPTMIGSDGLPHDVHPHPRLWGTFPRVLGHYCREVGLFSLEQAVRKMTGLSAARFGLTGRGVVAARRLCRSLRVRRRQHHRPRQLRRADPAGRRHRACLRQWPPGVVRRQANRRAPRTGVAAPGNAGSECPMSSGFPVIDLEAVRGPQVSAAARHDIAREVARACEEIGFFAVTGHGVPRGVIADLVAQSYAFFDLPLAEKLAVKRPRPEQNRGYIAPGEERLARLRGDETPPDLKELYTIGPFDLPDTRLLHRAGGLPELRAQPVAGAPGWAAARPASLLA